MDKVEELKQLLIKCRQIINKGYNCTKNSDLLWLNNFCAEFLNFTNELHIYVIELHKIKSTDGNEQIETIFLCLLQISTCIAHMEATLKAEIATGAAITASRQHFLDRIHWCLNRLATSLKELLKQQQQATHEHKQQQQQQQQQKQKMLEENSFVELMDLALDYLMPYSNYNEKAHIEEQTQQNVYDENAEAMFVSEQLRATINLILSHTLAFANVTLKEDKKALSALCQKVLRECISFQDECSLNIQEVKCNESNRKLKAITLENALYQLEDYINESLLRLVFTTFLDYDKFSIEKLRTVIRLYDASSSDAFDIATLDELIADFDVNIDRTTQIGIFAISFAPNIKMKTIVRSCLASLESLDCCIIPTLQTTKNTKDLYTEILEEHFNEEIANFKRAIQTIIDSQAFTGCYQELLTKCIHEMEKDYNKSALQDITQMGEFLYEHFQLQVNRKELLKDNKSLKLFEKFTLILRECQAILVCADQIDKKRILKRFKILRAILRKFLDTLGDKIAKGNGNGNAQNSLQKEEQIFLLSDELSDSQRMFASIGISPSICSILYRTNDEQMMTTKMRRRAVSDSLKVNYSKIMENTPKRTTAALAVPPKATAEDTELETLAENEYEYEYQRWTPNTIRRKQSLRTAMFKRQKSSETEHLYNIYKNNSTSLQISEILDQLTNGLSITDISLFEEPLITEV